MGPEVPLDTVHSFSLSRRSFFDSGLSGSSAADLFGGRPDPSGHGAAPDEEEEEEEEVSGAGTLEAGGRPSKVIWKGDTLTNLDGGFGRR